MINDYATLQAAVGNWLARADLATSIPDFIQLGEARLNRDVRTRQMQTLVTGTATGQTITLPTDLRGIQSLYVNLGGVGQELTALSPIALADRPAAGAGYPSGYVVVGNIAYLIGGAGNLEYTLVYFQAIPSIAVGQNWLILREPGLYLFSALGESAPYLKEDGRLVTWAASYKSIIDGMQNEDDFSRFGDAPTMRRPIRSAP